MLQLLWGRAYGIGRSRSTHFRSVHSGAACSGFKDRQKWLVWGRASVVASRLKKPSADVLAHVPCRCGKSVMRAQTSGCSGVRLGLEALMQRNSYR